MALHSLGWLATIRRQNWKFLLVHGGLQGRMAPVREIVSFALENSPELIIAPDVYRDQETTTKLTLNYVKQCPDDLMTLTAAVIQDVRLERFWEVVRLYETLGFDWIAVPSDNPVVELVPTLKDCGWKVHILGGMWKDAVVSTADSVDIVCQNPDDIKVWVGQKFSIPVEK